MKAILNFLGACLAAIIGLITAVFGLVLVVAMYLVPPVLLVMAVIWALRFMGVNV